MTLLTGPHRAVRTALTVRTLAGPHLAGPHLAGAHHSGFIVPLGFIVPGPIGSRSNRDDVRRSGGRRSCR